MSASTANRGIQTLHLVDRCAERILPVDTRDERKRNAFDYDATGCCLASRRRSEPWTEQSVRGIRFTFRRLVERLTISHPLVDLDVHNVWPQLLRDTRQELAAILYSLRADGVTSTGTDR